MTKERKCGCGKPALHNLWHCSDCIAKIMSDFNALQEAARSTHKGSGGAAMCICGAGCGGSSACNALSMLKIALTTKDKLLKDSIMYAIGWN